MGKQNRFSGKCKGSKNKKAAPRKYIGLRYASEEGEVYAKITKLFGGAQCEVICSDGVTRRLIIRAKFRGRRKRDNHIETGTWVLAGIRDWGNSTDSKQICDLLTVYSSVERDTLKKSGNADFTALLSNTEPGASGELVDDNTVFMEQDDTNIELQDDIKQELAVKEKTTVDHDLDLDQEDNDDAIFIDDI